MRIGKYQLVRKLASGGMAEVFLAKAAGPRGFEKTLVLKRILPHLAEDPAFVEMFLGEARLAAQLEHPNIVQIFDFGEAEGSFFLAMELIDGPNLRKLVKRAAEEALPPAFCAKVIAFAAEGLAYAHEFRDVETGEPLGLIHRDVSPDNILVSRQGAVKVVDFGIAKVAGQGHRTLTGVVKGKVAYMPPEQLQAKGMDRRVDVYALGVVLYELLTGKRPFDATTDVSVMQAILFESFIPVAQRRPDVPVALQQVLDKALAKDRERRYPDCRALQDDLERFVLSTGEPVGAYQISQRIAQFVSEGPISGSAPSYGGSQGAVPQEPKPVARASSMEMPVDSPSSTPPMPQSLEVPAAPAPLASTSPTTPMPMAVANTVREMEAQSPGVRDTLPSYPVVVKSPQLRSGASTRGTRSGARERLAPQANEPRETVRPAASRRASELERNEDAVAMAAVASAVPDVSTAPTRTPAADSDDAVHTRSTEYLAPLKAKRSGLNVAVVGGLVVLAVGGGIALMGGGAREDAPVRVTPPPLPVVERPSEPARQRKAQPVIVAESVADSQGVQRADRARVPVPAEETPEAKAPVPTSPPRDVQPAGASHPPESAVVVPAVAKAESPEPRSTPPASPPRVRESAPVHKAAVVAKGRLEFRIRPYAVVSLDGKVLGQTPFAAVEVPEGRHTVRIVNKVLGKDVTQTIDVKAGQSNVFKLNLELE
ncbi:Serine/threonine-protein kinase pkn6 [Myxococcus hansupus]|uniref:Serine/threonine-protein kinase pkn6 n=1 Tax=Pseudomyxococcus hansupus TaxID=1297742 RepID=A0A0H4X155_9BACT|nr:serine/threonine-protein kinase [Myxococcus hansupus]AKQ67578.1 Serine/threonine-protein kinase pkn6 [Myxococcus hansupus]